MCLRRPRWDRQEVSLRQTKDFVNDIIYLHGYQSRLRWLGVQRPPRSCGSGSLHSKRDSDRGVLYSSGQPTRADTVPSGRPGRDCHDRNHKIQMGPVAAFDRVCHGAGQHMGVLHGCRRLGAAQRVPCSSFHPRELLLITRRLCLITMYNAMMMLGRHAMYGPLGRRYHRCVITALPNLESNASHPSSLHGECMASGSMHALCLIREQRYSCSHKLVPSFATDGGPVQKLDVGLLPSALDGAEAVRAGSGAQATVFLAAQSAWGVE